MNDLIGEQVRWFAKTGWKHWYGRIIDVHATDERFVKVKPYAVNHRIFWALLIAENETLFSCKYGVGTVERWTWEKEHGDFTHHWTVMGHFDRAFEGMDEPDFHRFRSHFISANRHSYTCEVYFLDIVRRISIPRVEGEAKQRAKTVLTAKKARKKFETILERRRRKEEVEKTSNRKIDFKNQNRTRVQNQKRKRKLEHE